MKKNFLIACSALSMLFVSLLGMQNSTNSLHAAEANANTVNAKATHISLNNENGTNFYTLHFYDIAYQNGYNSQDFEYILNLQNTKDNNKTNADASSLTKWWNKNNNQDNDYLVCLGVKSDNHMVLPMWVTSFQVQAVSSTKWLESHKAHADYGIGKDIQIKIESNDNSKLVKLNEDDYMYNYPATKVNVKGVTIGVHSVVDLYTVNISKFDKIKIPTEEILSKGYYFYGNNIAYYVDEMMRTSYIDNAYFRNDDLLVYTPVEHYKDNGFIYTKYPDGLKDIRYYCYSNIKENNPYTWEERPHAKYTVGVNFNENQGGLVQVPIKSGLNNVIVSGLNDKNENVQFEIKNVFPSYYYSNKSQDGDAGDFEKFFAADLVFRIFESMENVKADGDIKANSLCGISKDDALKYLKEYEKLGNNSKSYFNKTKIETINHENLEAKRDYYFSEVMSMLTRIASGSTTNTANVLAHDNTIIISVSILTICALAFSAIILFKRKRFN